MKKNKFSNLIYQKNSKKIKLFFKKKENFPNLVNEYNNFQKYQSTKIDKQMIYKKR